MNNKGQTVKHFILDYELSRDRYYLTNIKELSTDNKVVSSYHLNYNPTGEVCRPGGRAYDFGAITILTICMIIYLWYQR